MAAVSPREVANELFNRQLSAEIAHLQPRDRARLNSLVIVDEIQKEFEYIGISKRKDFYELVKKELEIIYGNPLDYQNTNQGK
jgi:hypothetical protein